MQMQKVWHAAAWTLLVCMHTSGWCETVPKNEKLPVQVQQKPDGAVFSLATEPSTATSPSSSLRGVETFPCPAALPAREGAFELGASYGALFPSGLVGASETIPTFSLVLGAPLLQHTLQVQVDYGSTTSVRVFIAELNLRWTFDSPYLNSYFVTGANYVRQESDTAQASSRSGFGLTAGVGLAFDLGTQMEAHFELKGFVQSRTTILTGGGFSILL